VAYVQLTLQERYVIAHLRVCKLSYREIGRRLGRHHTTISREVARNNASYPNAVYWYDVAQPKALERRAIARHNRRLSHAPLRRYVQDALYARWSPQMIAGRLRLDYPRDEHMRVSVETLYRWVYRDARHGGQLHTCLCRGHRRRRRQCRYGAGRRHIPGRVGIELRPEVVALRRRFGDWEADSVIGQRGASAIFTQVERKSRFLLAGKLTDRTAASWNAATLGSMGALPRTLRRTLTVDNGSEFARFTELQRALGLSVYFADPYAAWQRGCNENSNGLLRRYFPKGTDFDSVSEERLAFVVALLNHRPRRCLGYRTSHEVFQRSLRGALGK